ncbi:microtubule associated protein [Seiridium cupressi]
MDAGYLSQQVNTIIGQLHGLFDEIGVPSHDRETREAELFAALSETLNNQVKHVTAEKKELVEEANRIITVIRQMEHSLDDTKSQRNYHSNNDELKITFPLTRCLASLKEKHQQISRLHRERFEQVKKLVIALESYSSHLEPTFVKIALPPTGPKESLPPSFDLSPAYVDSLDDEFTRVYEEYTRRVATVKALSEHIIQLWAELGTPQAQTDGAIVKYYRDSPEQLGLHEEDVLRLRGKRDKLVDEKRNREKRLKDLKAAVEALWVKLGIDESDRKAFLNGNRGCGVRQINEFEDELGRLNELKRQNLHLFVEDARDKLQGLWDTLYFSEDEMLDFTPAFSDVYSDALLEAHEREIARLEALREQRAPTLALVEKHRSLISERDELQASSQDASRLMMRGQKGEKRDPGKLLREEKMRKRITKELPKVAAELRKALEKWEDEYGRPFLVHGERYVEILEESEGRPAVPPRSKTPAGPPPSTSKKQPTLSRTDSTLSRANSTISRSGTISRPKTPGAGANGNGTIKRAPASNQPTNGNTSPSRLPQRAPLSNLQHGNNSPERPRPESRAGGTFRGGASLMRAPPPKMREFAPAPQLETPANPYKGKGLSSSIMVRPIEPEDVYDDRSSGESYGRQYDNESYVSHASMRQVGRSDYPSAPPPRQISNTSTVVSGSENWETYDDNSEPEADASDTYYAKLRAARGKRFTPEDPYSRAPMSQSKRLRGLPAAMPVGHGTIDAEGNRIISGSEWTDEDAF